MILHFDNKGRYRGYSTTALEFLAAIFFVPIILLMALFLPITAGVLAWICYDRKQYIWMAISLICIPLWVIKVFF